MSNLSAAVLAGGKNSRMSGFNKAFVRTNGIPVIQRTLKILGGVFEEIIIVTNSPKDFKLYEEKAVIIEDAIKGAGPLGGIYSALSCASKDAVFFVACDMPFLHNGLIRRQLRYFSKTDCDCLVPRIGDFVEPLHAVYKKALGEGIYNFLKNGNDYSIRSFLKTVKVCYWDLENNRLNRDSFRNLNTEEDLRKAKGALCG